MNSIEDRLTDALAARAQLETMDAETLGQRLKDLKKVADEGATHSDYINIDKLGEETTDTSRETMSPGRRWVAVAASAAAAALVLVTTLASTNHLKHDGAAPPASSPADFFEVLRRPQAPSDLTPLNGLPQETVRNSVRKVGASNVATYFVGITRDQHVCFGAVGPSGSGGSCTLGGRVDASDDLEAEFSTFVAWLVPDGHDTRGLRQQGFVSLAPDLWVNAASFNAVG